MRDDFKTKARSNAELTRQENRLVPGRSAIWGNGRDAAIRCNSVRLMEPKNGHSTSSPMASLVEQCIISSGFARFWLLWVEGHKPA
jgi:hypothetical protein